MGCDMQQDIQYQGKTQGDEDKFVEELSSFSLQSATKDGNKLFVNQNIKNLIQSLDYHDALNIYELDISSLKLVTNFSGLKQFFNLEILNVSGSRIESCVILQANKKLISLFASNCELISCQGIEVLSELKDLVLAENDIQDITPLSTLIKLDTLSLQKNKNLKVLNSLSALVSLTKLNFSFTKVEQFTFLTKLQNIEFLSLQGLNIVDLQDFPYLQVLKDLDISQSPRLISLNGIQNMPKVKRLNLYNSINILSFEQLNSLSLTDLMFNCPNIDVVSKLLYYLNFDVRFIVDNKADAILSAAKLFKKTLLLIKLNHFQVEAQKRIEFDDKLLNEELKALDSILDLSDVTQAQQEMEGFHLLLQLFNLVSRTVDKTQSLDDERVEGQQNQLLIEELAVPIIEKESDASLVPSPQEVAYAEALLEEPQLVDGPLRPPTPPPADLKEDAISAAYFQSQVDIRTASAVSSKIPMRVPVCDVTEPQDNVLELEPSFQKQVAEPEHIEEALIFGVKIESDRADETQAFQVPDPEEVEAAANLPENEVALLLGNVPQAEMSQEVAPVQANVTEAEAVFPAQIQKAGADISEVREGENEGDEKQEAAPHDGDAAGETKKRKRRTKH